MKISNKILFIIISMLLCAHQSSGQWILKNHSYSNTVNSMAANESTTICAGFEGDGIISSYDNGLTWSEGNTVLANQRVRALSAPYKVSEGVIGSVFLAGTWGDGVFRSTGPWVNSNAGLPNLYISTLFSTQISGLGSENNITLAGTWGNGAFISYDAGLNWIAVHEGLTYLCVRSLLIDDSNIFIGSINGLFRISVTNDTWTSANDGLTNTEVTALTRSGAYLFAGTSGGGIFRSTDNGTKWQVMNTGLNNFDIVALIVSSVSGGTTIFAATWGGGVYYSANNGEEWIAANEGMTCNLVRSLLVFNNILFSGNDDGSIWARPLSDFTTTDVHSTDGQALRQKFTLSQNYPNPFNPTTTIGFQIPQSGQVKLTVYDLFGKEVKTLINKEMISGSHQCVFDGSGLASGVYLYRLQANGFVQSKKFVLLK